MNGNPRIHPADVVNTYHPENGDVTAPDPCSHDIRENDFMMIREILGNPEKNSKSSRRAADDPGIAGYPPGTIRPDGGSIADES
jgi:hypothetical protein